MSLDPLNILLLAVALIVFWRLRSVLGTRTGGERPPADPFRARTEESKKDAGKSGTILRFPQAEDNEPRQTVESEPIPPPWAGFAEPDSDLASGLEQIISKDPTFTPRSFVDGAKLAYEMVIEGFAKGDKTSLKNLLSKDVFDGFAAAIDSREAAGQRVDQRFVGIRTARIKSASLMTNRAEITVEFVSELISATLSKSGEVVDGDPKDIREVTDVWTFERDVSSRNPNWWLAATQAQA
jgi:predicted lipid-binding transport protein (Tim44 family)